MRFYNMTSNYAGGGGGGGGAARASYRWVVSSPLFHERVLVFINLKSYNFQKHGEIASQTYPW